MNWDYNIDCDIDSQAVSRYVVSGVTLAMSELKFTSIFQKDQTIENQSHQKLGSKRLGCFKQLGG